MLRRALRWLLMLGVPHTCGDCGRPLDYGHNGAGVWWVACPKVTLHLGGDGYLEHNYPGHTAVRVGSRPEWTCDHEHHLRKGSQPSLPWWVLDSDPEGDDAS